MSADALPPRSRREWMARALAMGGLGLFRGAEPLLAQQLPLTPACHDGDEPTLPEIAGPFFKPRSPEREDLTIAGARGRPAEITGTVFTRGCRPLARALVDLWHADDAGEYDNRGFRYRGHVLT